MNFRVDTDTWFVFSVLFISALLFFIVGYVAIPYFIRKRQLNRIRHKFIWKRNLSEQLEKRAFEREISNLESRNLILETNIDESLQQLIKSDFNPNQVNSFYADFEKVYPHFSETLLKLIPNITAHELRVCSLIRLKLTAKEISRIMNITPASVNKARYRLRKKMTLAAKEDLDLFLLNI
ncbi:helix-turn-helix transcriptional regulator [Aquiflexum lacus]|uniref:helix-turn-helix transcriptional regulator n=1 Tax=Aquiflexum lacus TaxID=2483805 RepID=UPI0018941063|nr:hypothetical protein [Aquiflexum lacus]